MGEGNVQVGIGLYGQGRVRGWGLGARTCRLAIGANTVGRPHNKLYWANGAFCWLKHKSPRPQLAARHNLLSQTFSFSLFSLSLSLFLSLSLSLLTTHYSNFPSCDETLPWEPCRKLVVRRLRRKRWSDGNGGGWLGWGDDGIMAAVVRWR